MLNPRPKDTQEYRPPRQMLYIDNFITVFYLSHVFNHHMLLQDRIT